MGVIQTTAPRVTATGSLTPRWLADRAADTANLRDFGGGLGGDDALAMRRAIASGCKVIFVPPGTYTTRSLVSGPAHAAGPTAWLMDGVSDCYIVAYGARFLIDPAVQIGDIGSSFLQVSNNSKNCGMLGGTLVGDKTNLTPSRENCGFLIAGVTGLLLRDVKLTGQFLTAFAGVFAFDSLIENVHGYNLTNPVDISSLENTTFRGCYFQANPADPQTGVNCHYDTFTLADGSNITNEDGSARALRFGNTNGLVFDGCHFDGFYNGIFIDSCQGLLINKTAIRGTRRPNNANNSSGVTLTQAAAPIAAGFPTTDVVISDCEISGHGVTVTGGSSHGYGINIAAGAGTIAQVHVQNSRIYDNDLSGVGTSGLGATTLVSVIGCDFASRAGLTVQTETVAAAVQAVSPAIPLPQHLAEALTLDAGVSFGSLTGASNTDLSKHLNLFAGTIGLGVTAARLNYVVGAASVHAFMVGASQMATINSTGLNNTAIGITTAASARVTSFGANNATPSTKITVTGSRSANAALASALSALATYGLITDSTTV